MMRNKSSMAFFVFLFVVCLAHGAAMAASILLTNNLDVELRAVYGHAPGNTPWKIAEALAAGDSAAVESSSLRACGRLIVEVGGDEDEIACMQFFTFSYLEDANSITIAAKALNEGRLEEIPVLQTRFGGNEYEVCAGLSFDILRSHIDNGMDEKRYAEFMNPLPGGKHDMIFYAVALADTSWDIESPGPEFTPTAQGGKILSALTLTAPFAGKTLPAFLKEFNGSDVEPLFLQLNTNKIIAFGKEGLDAATGAVLADGMDTADAEKRWAALSELLANMSEADVSEDDPSIRLVLASPAIRYDLRLDFAEVQATFRIERK